MKLWHFAFYSVSASLSERNDDEREGDSFLGAAPGHKLAPSLGRGLQLLGCASFDLRGQV